MHHQRGQPRVHRSRVEAGWRVTVPVAVRRHLGLSTGEVVEFVVHDDAVVEIRRAGPEAARRR